MRTRFEIVLHGGDAAALRAAAEEALDEIQRIEAHLSFYRSSSLISKINRRAALEPVRIDPPLFRLLQRARALHEETGGAFDITIAPLLRAWGFVGGGGHLPDATELAAARAVTGTRHLILNAKDCTIRFDRPGVMIDLGAIGKGYALESAAELLREAGVTSGILHGGTSTVHAMGAPPGQDSWKVAIENPAPARSDPAANVPQVVQLRDEALSVSAVHGKSFQDGDRLYGHVLDPRAGEPVANAVLAAAVLPSATDSDALSTALLVGGEALHERLRRNRPELRALLADGSRHGPILPSGT